MTRIDRLWWALLASFVAFVFFGCGGGHGPRIPNPAVTAAPQTQPSPVPTHAVPCLAYTFGATAEQYRQVEAAGVVGVMEYVTFPPAEVCSRLAGTHLKLIRALYYGDATPATIEPVTQGVVRDEAACPGRLLWTYPFDEPSLSGRSPVIVEAALASVKKALPVPTFIAYGEQAQDKLPLYRGLDFKGVELYARRWLDPKNLHARLDRLNGQPLVLIVRAWRDEPPCCGGAFGTWRDAESAQLVHLAMAEARARPNVHGVLFYVATDGGTDHTRSNEWLEMPLTRAAITDVCR